MSVHYTEDFKKEVVKAYMAGDKSIQQLAVDFNVAKSSVSKWVNEYKEECLYTTSTSSESNEAKGIRRLNQLLNGKDKEIAFLKKQRHSSQRKSISGIYNCSIIDLYDRSAVASLNSDYINTDLAIDTLKTALKKEKLS